MVCLFVGCVDHVRSLRYRPIVIRGLESLPLRTMADVRGTQQYWQNEYIAFKKFMPKFSGTGLFLNQGYTCNLNERRKLGRKWPRTNERMGKGRHTKEVTREDQKEDSIYSEPTGEENNTENEIRSLGHKQWKGKRKGGQAWRQIRHENTKSNRPAVSG